MAAPPVSPDPPAAPQAEAGAGAELAKDHQELQQEKVSSPSVSTSPGPEDENGGELQQDKKDGEDGGGKGGKGGKSGKKGKKGTGSGAGTGKGKDAAGDSGR
jgi:hypothetical protein